MQKGWDLPILGFKLSVLSIVLFQDGLGRLSQHVASVLHKRMTQSNPQKVWLAVVLAKQVKWIVCMYPPLEIRGSRPPCCPFSATIFLLLADSGAVH
jgi:hypothetical protein